MPIKKFYNRENELSLLKKVKKPYLAIIYGRRRIGKTSLVLKFVENKPYIYFFMNPRKSENLLLEEFESILKEKMNLPNYIKIQNWEHFFEILFNYKGYIIFDEFQWSLEINKQIPYILQKYWDIKRNPTIIITGSIIGLLKKLFKTENSPLFKRAEIIIELKELPIKDVFKLLEDLKVKNLEDKFKFYMLFGGVPYYYKLLDKYKIKTIEESIENLVVDEFGPLRNEVEETLIESFKREYKTYLSILLAIAEGKTKYEYIANYAGIKPTSLSYYLDDLINTLNIIEKHQIGFKRKYIYLIKDKFYNFWLRFIYKNSGIINKEILLRKIFENINSFFGWSFENMIRENLLKIFPNFEKIFKYYGKTEKSSFDIDIVAINEHTKEILFCECKWKDKVNPKQICKELVEKSAYVNWYNNNRKEYFVIFAKSFKEKISEFEGYKVWCFDLKEIYKYFSI